MKIFNKKNKNVIIGYENEHLWMPPIVPTKNVVPDWYKNISPLNVSSIKSFPVSLNIKACIPFLDTLTSGYIIPLPMDIAVKIDENGSSVITWPDSSIDIIGLRDGSEAPGMETPRGFQSTHFVWKTMVAIKLPKGYSCLVTHPLNRHDLPFITLSGIIDADSIFHEGNIPFFIKKDFEGLIKAGTQILQIIPFKRENWILRSTPGLFKIGNVNGTKSFYNTFGWYKKNNWKRKIYE